MEQLIDGIDEFWRSVYNEVPKSMVKPLDTNYTVLALSLQINVNNNAVMRICVL